MSLLGNAVVSIWNDIVPERRAEYVEWHNREHMPERVGIPGFLRGRRYLAEYGSPEYYTLYEAENVSVLTGSDYLERLNNPTPWTRSSITAFRNLSRGLCNVIFSQGLGDGAFILTLQLRMPESRQADAKHHLIHKALPDLLRMQGVTGAHLCITDRDASETEAAERRGMSNSIPDWIVLIEASFAKAADEAAEKLRLDDTMAELSPPIVQGLYRLEISRLKDGGHPDDR